MDSDIVSFVFGYELASLLRLVTDICVLGTVTLYYTAAPATSTSTEQTQTGATTTTPTTSLQVGTGVNNEHEQDSIERHYQYVCLMIASMLENCPWNSIGRKYTLGRQQKQKEKENDCSDNKSDSRLELTRGVKLIYSLIDCMKQNLDVTIDSKRLNYNNWGQRSNQSVPPHSSFEYIWQEKLLPCMKPVEQAIWRTILETNNSLQNCGGSETSRSTSKTSNISVGESDVHVDVETGVPCAAAVAIMHRLLTMESRSSLSGMQTNKRAESADAARGSVSGYAFPCWELNSEDEIWRSFKGKLEGGGAAWRYPYPAVLYDTVITAASCGDNPDKTNSENIQSQHMGKVGGIMQFATWSQIKHRVMPIRSLSLSNNTHISRVAGLAMLMPVLKEYTSVGMPNYWSDFTAVAAIECNITCKTLLTSQYLCSLDLRSCNITSGVIDILCKYLDAGWSNAGSSTNEYTISNCNTQRIYSPPLSTLILSNNPLIGYAGAMTLSRLLCKHTTKRIECTNGPRASQVSQDSSNVPDVSMISLSSSHYHQFYPPLRILNLSHCNIGYRGVQSFANILFLRKSCISGGEEEVDSEELKTDTSEIHAENEAFQTSDSLIEPRTAVIPDNNGSESGNTSIATVQPANRHGLLQFHVYKDDLSVEEWDALYQTYALPAVCASNSNDGPSKKSTLGGQISSEFMVNRLYFSMKEEMLSNAFQDSCINKITEVLRPLGGVHNSRWLWRQRCCMAASAPNDCNGSTRPLEYDNISCSSAIKFHFLLVLKHLGEGNLPSNSTGSSSSSRSPHPSSSSNSESSAHCQYPRRSPIRAARYIPVELLNEIFQYLYHPLFKEIVHDDSYS